MASGPRMRYRDADRLSTWTRQFEWCTASSPIRRRKSAARDHRRRNLDCRDRSPNSTFPSVLEGELKLEIKNEISELKNVMATLAQFLEAHRVPHRAAYAVNLAVDELVVNVIRYAYVDDDAHMIDLDSRDSRRTDHSPHCGRRQTVRSAHRPRTRLKRRGTPSRRNGAAAGTGYGGRVEVPTCRREELG